MELSYMTDIVKWGKKFLRVKTSCFIFPPKLVIRKSFCGVFDQGKGLLYKIMCQDALCYLISFPTVAL